MIFNDDTICAIATPPGVGAIGVVRVSGPETRNILAKLWRGRIDADCFEPRKLYLGEVVALNDEGEKRLVDRVFAVWMPAPHTYTGQDMVEFSCHGSPIVLRDVLGSCLKAGARPAGPGEFTRRAFLSGKIDLAQAEAVADLISASSERGARLAAEQLAGHLSDEIHRIEDRITELRTFVEASIDFPEEDIEFVEKSGTLKSLKEIISDTEKLARTYHKGRLMKEGVRVAIVGRPNAGKSSIFNRLIGCRRALVHDLPGTTRDVIEEAVSISGVAFRLRDTAGVRSDALGVEALGIRLSRDEITKADALIVVFDGSLGFDGTDIEVLRSVGDKRAVYVINKTDLPIKIHLQPPSPLVCPERSRRVGEGWGEGKISFDALHVSATTGAGFEELQRRLVATTEGGRGHAEGVVITSSRHKAALDEAATALASAGAALSKREPLEFIALHLRAAQESLGAITGIATTEVILDRIFSRFCIGK